MTSSDKPSDKAVTLACRLVVEMTGERKDVVDALIKNKAHFTMIAKTEKTTDPPEYSDLPDYYNTRARGLGGLNGMCAEESILCDRSDRWCGESICVHEYAHTISLYGLFSADKTFQERLNTAYEVAKAKGLYRSTYAESQPQEYWAEGVQNWYDTNREPTRPTEFTTISTSAMRCASSIPSCINWSTSYCPTSSSGKTATTIERSFERLGGEERVRRLHLCFAQLQEGVRARQLGWNECADLARE